MSDAISRSAVIDIINEERHFIESLRETVYYNEDRAHNTGELGCAISLARKIKELPALDVALVVHAHWIKTFGSDGFVSTLRCSKCGNAENSTYIPGNFCWFCGARMDGEAE